MVKKIWILFFLSTSLLSMEEEEKIKVITSDGVKDTIPEKHALMCGTIRHILEDLPNKKKSIPLPNISSAQLPAVKKFLKNSYLLQQDSTSHVLRQSVLSDFKTDLDTQEKLYPILCAANYLDIHHLLTKCKRIWAKAKYVPTKVYPLPTEIDVGIAGMMLRTKRLVNETAEWVAQDLQQQSTSLCTRTIAPYAESVWSNAISHDGRLYAGGHAGGIISIFDTQTDLLDIIDSGHANVSMIQFNSDSSQAWSSGQDGTIRVWDLAANKNIATYQAPTCRAFVFRYIPEYNMLVADGTDHNICLWDISQNATEPELLDAHSDNIMTIETTRDGSYFVSGSEDGIVRLWDTHNKKSVMSLNHLFGVMSTSFNQKKDTLACGLQNGTVVVTNLETGKILFHKNHHHHGIWSVLFADNRDTLLCSGAKDSLIKLWDMRMHKPIMTLTDHTDAIQFMALDPERNLLSSASHDQTIKVWDLRHLLIPICALRKEFSRNTTIRQILMLEDADKAETPLDMDNPTRKKLLQLFSPPAQKLLTDNLNMTKPTG